MGKRAKLTSAQKAANKAALAAGKAGRARTKKAYDAAKAKGKKPKSKFGGVDRGPPKKK